MGHRICCIHYGQVDSLKNYMFGFSQRMQMNYNAAVFMQSEIVAAKDTFASLAQRLAQWGEMKPTERMAFLVISPLVVLLLHYHTV